MARPVRAFLHPENGSVVFWRRNMHGGLQQAFGLVENLDTIFTPGTQRALFCDRQFQLCHTDFTATTVKLRRTAWALNKQQVADVVFAVGMVITRGAALVTMRDHVIRNTFAHALIKDKILAFKFNRQTLLFRPARIFNNAAFDVIHIFKPVVQHVSAGFFTADPASAVHDNFLFFVFFQHINGHWQLIAESVRWHFDRFVEMPY